MLSTSTVVERAGEDFGTFLADQLTRLRTKTVTVVSIDEAFAYCTIYEDDTPLPVPLKFLAVADGFFKVVPTLDSVASISFLNGDDNNPYFTAFTSVDKVEFIRSNVTVSIDIDPDDEASSQINVVVGGSRVRITPEVVEFNGGTNDGTVLINELTSRLNKLQSELDTFVQAFNTHTHPYTWTGSPGAGPTSPTTTSAQPPSTFSKEEYENVKITQ